jgi:preprotein translocase subunit SecD
LDGVPISAPVVESEITNGQAVISGGFTLPEARQLAGRLNAGALPVPITLEGQQTVGPSLGKTSIQKSLVASVVGFILVVAWMISFYRLPGLLASLALVVYVILLLALIKLIPITLTLAGIAGAIMSVGIGHGSRCKCAHFRESPGKPASG